MLLHSWFDPEIVAHCTVNTFAYRSLTFDTAMAKTEHLPSEIFGRENGRPCPRISEHVNNVCCCFSFLQRAYTEEELNAKLTRRVQKAARRQAKQEELKRLHRAQVASHKPLVMAHNDLCVKAPWSWPSSECVRTESSLSTWVFLLLLPLSNFMSCHREVKNGWNLSWGFYREKNNAHNTFLAGDGWTIMHWKEQWYSDNAWWSCTYHCFACLSWWVKCYQINL